VHSPQRLIGIYRADGGLLGELRYLAGHLLKGEHCTLCDITHAGVSRKRSWDAAVAERGIPFTLLHRNEMDPGLEAFVADRAACVVAEDAGSYVLLLGNDDLQACKGNVDAFFARLDQAMATHLSG
jgi:hypothetical protein